MSKVEAYEILGVRVHALTEEIIGDKIGEAMAAGQRCIIGNHNSHSVYLYHRDAKMRSFYARSQYIFIDSMPLLAVGNVLGFPLRRENRTRSLEWLRPAIRRAAAEGRRVFLLGSLLGVAEEAADILRAECPGLQVDVHHGYFDATPGSEEFEAVIARIQAFRPHLLVVGMGMPRQECWIVDALDRIDANVILPLGAAIDQIAGRTAASPYWTGQIGLEWLYLLLREPKRSWRRYLVEPWFLLPILVRDVVRARLKPRDQLRAADRGASK
ncbi:MAG: WecB/TagA/CpsF family glycosyltransferase [Gemmatimonadetes bacterium]|nr:WecB/TagA/CpsF family glycosyltransferase [Gemmatimonadota bacterium]